MDFKKIRLLVEDYRVLTGFASLPFLVESENRTKICWFNFFLDQNEDHLKIHVDEIFTMSDSNIVSSDKVNINVCVQLKEYGEPQMQEEQYFSELERLYAQYAHEQIMDLLKSAEMSPLLPAYKKVADFVREKEK